MRSGRHATRRQHGFSYLLLLVVVAVMAITAQSVATGLQLSRSSAERALLDAGEELRAGLMSYRLAGGGAMRSGPREVADLLRDPRVPGVKRHLRRLPVDPLTGQATWGVVRDESGEIVAFHSLADGEPQKREGFDVWQAGFENAASYAQWRFGPPPMPR